MSSFISADLAAVGDHFLVGLRPGVVLDRRDRELLARIRPAGVILFKSNFEHDVPYGQWLATHSRLIDSIRAAIRRERVFLAIDHEGGRVCRTPAPITRYGYAARWAEHAEQVGEAMGQELAALGLNLNFAPVLDIHSNPANPVIGERAFGTSASEVIAAAIPFLHAMERQGVKACGKHFPGHGDTSTDSHHELPRLDLTLAEMEGRELEPFMAAIDAGLSMIMTSHLLIPDIDPEVPVTLSRKATHELLRQKLGFDGLIVSDDVGMHAMDGWLVTPDSALRLFEAGHDLLMICAHWTDTDRVLGFASSLLQAERDGRIDSQALAASRERIQKALGISIQHGVRALPSKVFEQHRQCGALFRKPTVEVI